MFDRRIVSYHTHQQDTESDFLSTQCVKRAHVISKLTPLWTVFLQVTGVSAITSAALITPFLTMAALSSTITNHIAYKTGYVRPIFFFALAILPVGMVC